MGVISHKGAYWVGAGSELEVIVGQNQCCLPPGGVSRSIRRFEDGPGSLHPNKILTA